MTQHINTSAILHFMTILVPLAVALLLGIQIGKFGIRYQDLIILAGLITIVVIALHRRGLELGFLLWITMFALGFRVTRVNVPLAVDRLLGGSLVSYLSTGSTPIISIQPLSVVIASIFFFLVLRAAAVDRNQIKWQLPRPLLLLGLFGLWGWYRGISLGTSWNWMFPEAICFFLAFPIFVVTNSLLRKPFYWRTVFVIFYATGSVIALLGCIEFYFPAIRYAIPGFIADGALVTVAQDGFARAEFAFWGHAGAIFISLMGLSLIIPLWQWFPNVITRAGLIVALVVQLWGVYLAGWRSTWLLLFGVLAALFILQKAWSKLLFAAIIVYITITLNVVPTVALVRLETIISAFDGKFQDHSTAERAARADTAWRLALDNPLGVGWGGSGWVHSDFIQVAANLGVVAGLIFAGWYLTTLFRIIRLYNQSRDLVTLSLVGCFLFMGGLFLTQPLLVLPQYAAPPWFIWAIVETRLRQMDHKEQSIYATN